MTPEQARLVTTSWSSVASIADSAIAQFYRRLFEIDPSARALFRATDMPEQRRKVIEALSLALQSLDDLEALTPTLEELGRRHWRYGVTAAHYDSGRAGAALDAGAGTWRRLDARHGGSLDRVVRPIVGCHETCRLRRAATQGCLSHPTYGDACASLMHGDLNGASRPMRLEAPTSARLKL